jgi:predicted dehydrogenase
VQTQVIKKSLTKGKHILSEKPIAADTQDAIELIDQLQHAASNSIWMVAENFRFLDPVAYGHAKVKELGGELVTFHINFFTLIDESDKFYQTEWLVKTDLP